MPALQPSALIRNYNEALERAREVWLREGLPSAAFQRMLTLKGPLHLCLPAFTDDAQRQRAAEQQERIFERLGQGRSTLPQTPPLSPEEAAECLVCTTLGGGVEIAAYQRDGKWRVCKLLSLSSGQLTPEERRIFQMPAPASYHGVRLAAVIASFILARQGVASLVERTHPPLSSGSTQPKKPPKKVAPPGHRGDQSKFAKSVEEIVSEELGIPRNEQGPHEPRIPGRGPSGYRVPDLKFRGFEGSLRRRGTVVEIKYVKDGKFGSLPKRARDQILDAVAYVQRLHAKESLVRSEADRKLLREARVEVFSNAAPPVRGKFAKLIKRKLLKWEPLPQVSSTSLIPHRADVKPKSIGKPGLGTTQSIALGVLISIVEASVADSLYRDTAQVLDDLLRQIADNEEADEKEWGEIEQRLRAIASMKQSFLGYIWEFISYGQGSLVEKQAVAMHLLAAELAEKHGYQNHKTWNDLLDGRIGRYEKRK